MITSRNLNVQGFKMAVQCRGVVMTSKVMAVQGIEMLLLWLGRGDDPLAGLGVWRVRNKAWRGV